MLPSAVRLLYLSDGIAITCTPSAQNTRFIEKKVEAIWTTIQRANKTDSFKPQPGRLCDWCAFQPFCPSFGGDPDEGRRLGEALRAERRADGGGTDTLGDLVDPLPLVTAAQLTSKRSSRAGRSNRPSGSSTPGPTVRSRCFGATPPSTAVMYAATELGDFSLIWQLIATTRGLRGDRHAADAVRIVALLGAESALVNGVIKSFFRRRRPEWEQHRNYKIRKPRSSSFPSGHASSAFLAAALLSELDEDRWPVWYALAVVVATSRAHVRIHHASDVVGRRRDRRGARPRRPRGVAGAHRRQPLERDEEQTQLSRG